MIKYQYASDSTGSTININDVTPADRLSTQFFCIGCDAEMSPVLGEKKQHHFRHKEDCKCNSETYLHQLGKKILKLRFDCQPQFLIQYFVDNNCHRYSECQIRQRHNWRKCSSNYLKTIDLKEFYDTCEVEAAHKGFRADLMLTHSEYPKRNPVFLEISVTHDCDQQKIDSGIRIIEIKVQTEQDTLRPIIEAEKKKNITPIFYEKESEPIRFYNFKRNLKEDGLYSLVSFSLFLDDNAHIGRVQIVRCGKQNQENEQGACFGVIISEDSIPQDQYGYGKLHTFGLSLALKQGIKIKSCIFCKFYERCTIPSDNKLLEFSRDGRIRVCKLLLNQLEGLRLTYTCRDYQFYEPYCRRGIRAFGDIPHWEWSKSVNDK